VDTSTLKAVYYPRNISSYEGFTARQQNDGGTDLSQVGRDPVNLFERGFTNICIGINDIALLTGEIAPGGYIKLHIQRVVLEKHSSNQATNRVCAKKHNSF
jgi:hypothetical protein